MRREFRATCRCSNIFCHKMINSGLILMFQVSIEPYWLAQYDWIFEIIVPLPSWWQKLELNNSSLFELFEELLSWNLDSKMITPKYITCTYFGDIVVIFNFFWVWFLYIIFFLTPEWAQKQGPATCMITGG